jgi:4-amino-4-deoxy-L-arabinose transferase-like glycosyltransferase
MRQFFKRFGIVVVILLAFLVRVYRLDVAPPSLYWEEVALGYDAYSILKTGRDHHGNPWPIVAFESFGDFKPALYYYLIVPFIPLFGLNAWSVRLPAALLGTLTVWLVYELARLVLKSKRAALAGALVLAVLPWHIQFSRAGFEVTVATCLLTLGVYAVIRGIFHNPRWWYVGAVSLVLSMYTYHGLRVLAPLMVIWLGIVYGKNLRGPRTLAVSFILGLVMVWPLTSALRTREITQRFSETSLFSVSMAVEKTNNYREADGNTLLAWVIHHRYGYWAKEILAGSLRQLSPAFLFLTGDDNPRHQTGYYALFYYWMIIPLMIGIYTLLKRRDKTSLLIFGWIMLATIPAALTKTTPHTLRFLPASPAFALVIGMGIDAIWKRWQQISWRRALVLVSIILISLEALAYGYDYLLAYRFRSGHNWQYGYEEVMAYIQTVKDDYTRVLVTRAYGRPSMYALFYWQTKPTDIQSMEPQIPQDQGELLQLDNVYFGNTDYAVGDLVVSEKELETGRLVNTFYGLDGSRVFYAYAI